MQRLAHIVLMSVFVASSTSGTESQTLSPPRGRQPSAQICCDGGAQHRDCEYEVFNGEGESILKGELKHGSCLTLGPAFDGLVVCDCAQV